MEGENKNRILFFSLAATVVIGILLIILACTLYETVSPMLIIPLLIFAPVPNILVSFLGGGPFAAGPTQGVQETAKFLTGMLGSSALILPFFLCHLEVITLAPAILTCCGTAVMCCSILLFQLYFNPENPNIY